MREFPAVIENNMRVARGIYRLDLVPDSPLGALRAGQFVNLSLGRQDLLLKRPFGILDFSAGGSKFSLCYQVVGKGTEYLTKLPQGAALSVTGPLGNGFTLAPEHKRVALIGGGVGIFPLHSLFTAYKDREFASFIGFRSADLACCVESFEAHSEAHFATDDGSFGEKGNALELYLKYAEKFRADVVLACGPMPMLRALQREFSARDIRTPAFVSVEERMGCGIGACLVCACGKKQADGTVKNVRVCRDGPVFALSEVVL